MSNSIINRILTRLGDAGLLERLRQLPPTELQSLLLEINRQAAAGITPQQLLRSYETNRFVTPSTVDPIAFYEMEVAMLRSAKESLFEPLELSPLAPLGNCSAIGLADQNKIVSAVRGTEVVADSTNLMALECAVRRKQSKFDNSVVGLCSIHRHVRAQAIPDIKGFTPHFKIFTAVTAGRDTGSLQFEKMALLKHLSFYKKYFVDQLRLDQTKVIIKGLKGEDGNTWRSQQLFDHVRTQLTGVDLSFAEVPEDQHRYYQHTRFSLNIDFKGKEYNLGDGGFVDWGAKLTSNGKERMFTSGVGVELLIKLQTGLI
jgi:hypothetical protein